MVEIWFGIIERQAIRRGTFTSVRDLIAKIRGFINGWNNRCQPFVWTKPPIRSWPKPTVNKLRTRDTSAIDKELQRVIAPLRQGVIQGCNLLVSSGSSV